MLRLWKTMAVILAVALTVTACGAGTGSQGAEGTKANGMAGGITGQNLRDSGRIFGDHNGNRNGNMNGNQNHSGNAAANDTNEDQQQRSGNRISAFPRNAVRPLENAGGGMGILSAGPTGNQPITVPYVKDGNENYISVDTLVQVLQFENYEVDDQGAREIGDKDVMFRLVPGSREAEKEGKPFKLSAAPKMVNGKLMISASTAADLFSEEMVYELGANGLQLFPSDTDAPQRDTDQAVTHEVNDALDFADDPNDPFKGEEAEGAFSSIEEAEAALETLEALAADPEAVPALKNININGMISTAKKYLGVKYKFGARPYPQSNRFDCSSYTQYVFAKYGVKLPRTAREQINVGTTISRKSLRKGDLLFFYVPGRFKSNKVAGHVGIYMGNRMMIHANTEPKNGVQTRSIDRAFWKETFLKAKRIAY
jgi:cell wall-associated NlpC family hydrolase